MADNDNELAAKLAKTLDELGYFIENKDGVDAIIYFKSIGEVVSEVLANNALKDKIIISVTEDGNYVIPILGEEIGGSIIGGIVADILSSQLVLTSKTSQLGVYSIREFAWINAIKFLNPDEIPIYEKKLIKEGKLKVFSEDLGIAIIEGYETTDDVDKADIVITSDENLEIGGKLVAKPLQLAIALDYQNDVPKEALYFAIASTLKSISIKRRKVDFLIVPKEKENEAKIKEVSKFFNSIVIYVPTEKEGQICNSLCFTNSKIVLKQTKRAYGVYTCLGLEKE